ncbi:tyrosine-type recombinase/integrase [Euzebya tangerina]|uniref:tyrosine-type recombinase/integrase n=1 Tax=Euzebya tangerina TaxID=591198 RepID=UPI000E323A13|nr:site-specific integrase [Euzebya tangerina]
MATITKRPESAKPWQVRYRDEAGKSRSKQFRRKTDAEAFVVTMRADKLRGDWIDPDAGTITFREYAEEWRQVQMIRPTTAKSYESHLRRHAYPAIGDRQLRRIRPGDIQKWVKGLSEQLAPSTVAVIHGITFSIFKSAVRDQKIRSNPCDGTRLPEVVKKPVEPLTVAQVEAVRDAMPEHYRAAVTLAATTGLRIGEVFGLTMDRLDLGPDPVLTVDRQLAKVAGEPPFLGPPKRKASRREIPLPRTTVEALQAHIEAFSPESQKMPVRDAAHRLSEQSVSLVFTTGGRRPVARNTFSPTWRKAANAAGVPDATFHHLRHTYASLLIQHGESVKVVQARLGHATAGETLDTYRHMWPDSDDSTRAAVDGIFG